MGFALSTSWNASRYQDAEGMLSEIAGAGFNEVELSFNLSASMVSGVKDAVARGQLGVVSCHNYCPIPEGLSREQALPDCFSMASVQETERAEAVRLTLRTIDSCRQLGARAAVLHCGRVEVPDRTRELIALYESGRRNTPEFGRLLQAALNERSSLKGDYLAAALKSLREISSYAVSQNIILGIENRFYIREIPSFEEIALILDNIPNAFYWHDTGHAQLMENLGVAFHRDFLDRYYRRMAGMHIHDIRGCQDHLAPGKGDLDFNLIKPYLTPGLIHSRRPNRTLQGAVEKRRSVSTLRQTPGLNPGIVEGLIKVIEAHSPATSEEIIASRIFLTRARE